MNKTFAIIKPDVVKAKNTGKVIDMIEKHGFELLGMKKLHLTKEQAEAFYEVHKDRPFFDELVEFMISGPVVVMVISKENAIPEWRNLMGDTDSQNAKPGTIRNKFGTDKGINAVHGSDAPETAKIEIQQFFPELL
jgi:nucleoside-diphosphate kinase